MSAGRSVGVAATGVEAFLSRYRSLPTGFYREFEPAPDLRAFVACGWIKSVRRASNELVPIIPDGCSDIMTYDDDAPFVVGPDATTRWARLPDGLVITGLRLRPGAARRVLGCPAPELLGQSIPLSALARDSRALHGQLQGCHAPAARLSLLESWLRGRLEGSAPRDLALLSACRTITKDPQIDLDALSQKLGWNSRMLHREFVAACGYGPKYLLRIMRVQGAVRAAFEARPARRLSEIAAACGFSDQAHMARDFRSLTGFTPSEYLAAADGEVGRWIDAERDDDLAL